MKLLAVYGASGLGKEVLELAKIINERYNRWSGFIFIDDGNVPDKVDNIPVYTYEEAKDRFYESIEVTVGIGEPATREQLFKTIKRDSILTPTLIHPDVYIPSTTRVGNGVVIQYGCFISCNVSIKDYVFVQPQSNIGHDGILEEGCMLAGFSNVGGLVSIGRYSYIGMSSAIKQTINIGAYSIIGMGSIVHKDVPDEVIVMGNPARIIARNEGRRVFGR